MVERRNGRDWRARMRLWLVALLISGVLGSGAVRAAPAQMAMGPTPTGIPDPGTPQAMRV